MSEDYVPYGTEWEKEMMKLPKFDLIQMFKMVKQQEQTPCLKCSTEFAVSVKMVTDNMLHAAMEKAVELGLMSKYAHQDEYMRNFGRMKEVLNAALLEA